MRQYRLQKPVSIIVLAIFVSGCSTYRVSSLPPNASSGELPATAKTTVEKGQEGRVFLKNGKSIAGTITEVSHNSITVGKVGNYGFEETVVLASEIDRIEIQSESAADPLMTSLAGTVVISAGVIMLAALFGALEFGPFD